MQAKDWQINILSPLNSYGEQQIPAYCYMAIQKDFVIEESQRRNGLIINKRTKQYTGQSGICALCDNSLELNTVMRKFKSSQPWCCLRSLDQSQWLCTSVHWRCTSQRPALHRPAVWGRNLLGHCASNGHWQHTITAHNPNTVVIAPSLIELRFYVPPNTK